MSEHEHSLSCLEEVSGQLVCKYEILRKPMTESEADTRAKSIWGPRGFARQPAPGLFEIGFYRSTTLGNRIFMVKGGGKSWEEAFASGTKTSSFRPKMG